MLSALFTEMWIYSISASVNMTSSTQIHVEVSDNVSTYTKPPHHNRAEYYLFCSWSHVHWIPDVLNGVHDRDVCRTVRSFFAILEKNMLMWRYIQWLPVEICVFMAEIWLTFCLDELCWLNQKWYFFRCSLTLIHILRKYNKTFHLFADDTLIYFSCDPWQF